jgi:multisubunit Na+/H+ antiporter MnhF subunit
MAICGPIALILSSSPSGEFYQIVAAPWQIIQNRLVLLDPSWMSIYFSLTIPRLAFAYQMYRCYRGETTRARTLAVGVLSELYIAILSIPVFLIRLQAPPPRFIQIALPIPLLLVIGVILLGLTPPPRLPETWEEVERMQSKARN